MEAVKKSGNWKPLYNILESSELPAMVVNARHMKNVPGRKTDVKDAEWIAHNLKASNEQLADDLNGVMTPLQRKLMKDGERKASKAIRSIPGIAESSANARVCSSGVFDADRHLPRSEGRSGV